MVARSVAFRSAKAALEDATFWEQKATKEQLARKNSQPIRESSLTSFFRGAKGDNKSRSMLNAVRVSEIPP